MSDPLIILIDEHDHVHEISGQVRGTTVALDGPSFAEATGWVTKPEGLCRGDLCLPRTLWPDLIDVDGWIDAEQFGAAGDQPVVVDPDAGVVAIGTAGSVRRDALETLDLPTLDTRDLDGDPVDLEQYRGKKKLL